MAVEIQELWDFSRPEVSEQRFRAAMANASPDELLILETQIARTYGLRGDFLRAREILAGIAAKLPTASAEAQVRYRLELGRTFSSATHPAASQTPEVKQKARTEYLRALEVAKASGLDELTVDALHMMAFVDTDPPDQLKWDTQALAVVETSKQEAAKRWEPSIRNNVGYDLHELGRFDEALAQFKKALALRERGTNAEATRNARWMVAWTLRSLRRLDEAIDIQLALERELDAIGAPDFDVFDELELLYRQKGDNAKANHYAQRKLTLDK